MSITFGAKNKRTLPPRARKSQMRLIEHPCAEIRAAMELAREINEGPHHDEPEPQREKNLAA